MLNRGEFESRMGAVSKEANVDVVYFGGLHTEAGLIIARCATRASTRR